LKLKLKIFIYLFILGLDMLLVWKNLKVLNNNIEMLLNNNLKVGITHVVPTFGTCFKYTILKNGYKNIDESRHVVDIGNHISLMVQC
jgi:hypothetical protein